MWEMYDVSCKKEKLVLSCLEIEVTIRKPLRLETIGRFRFAREHQNWDLG